MSEQLSKVLLPEIVTVWTTAYCHVAHIGIQLEAYKPAQWHHAEVSLLTIQG